MLEIDLERKTVLASVRDLIEEPLDVPRPAGLLATARSQLGTDVHRRYRVERERGEAAFEAEVFLTLDCEIRDFAVHLRGRADGIVHEPDRLVVEEVKSVDLAGDALAGTTLAEHADAARQARLYALCLARRDPDAEVAARLRLVSIVDGNTKILDTAFDVGAAERLLERLVVRRLRTAQEARAHARRRAGIAEALAFPYGEPRPYQDAFAERVKEGLEASRPVLAMAPTGVGKTVGALLPALEFALANDAILFFLTAKTTQQDLVARTFADVVAASGGGASELRALTFREKRRMCPPGTLLCHPDHCAHLVRFLQRQAREAVLEELLDGPAHVEPDAVYEAGEVREVCPYAMALALSLRVDLVICDVNYVYDPAVSLSLFGEGAKAREVVAVIDEAHNLFDRAREYYSPFVSRRLAGSLGERVRRGELLDADATDAERALFDEIGDHLDRLVATIDRIAEGAAEENPASIDGCRPVGRPVPAWEHVADDAARLMVAYAHHQQTHGLVSAEDDLLSFFGAELAVRNLLLDDAPEFVPYVATSREAPEGPGFGILCVNPAAKLAERHAELEGAVAMSATLHPLPYYRDVLGFAGLDPIELALPSPFPEEHRGISVVTSVATTWRERKRHHEGIARRIEEVVAARPGNYVAYFPSFRFLEDVRKHLRVEEDALIVQTRRRGKERAALLERFRDPEAPSLLLAVMGGVFAEGIDLPGEELVGAIVVGPGLPQVGFERALMQHYFDETVQRGFAYAMLFPGMQRVIQAAGRVHRTPDDKGVIVLLGRRFARSPYVDCLPAHWYRYDPSELWEGDLKTRLERFWRS